MIAPERPADEADRLHALHALQLLDSAPEERFETLTRVAAQVFAVPIAVVTLVDAQRQWFKSCLGLAVSETPRDISFCGHAILGEGIFEVEDALADARFADNPLVLGPPHIRFYAGVPLRDQAGHRLGSFAVIDRQPRRLAPPERVLLGELAALAEMELDRIRIGVQHAQDTARLLEQEARLRFADQQKDRFLATLAHELRNPLAPIRNSVHLAKLRQPGDAAVARALDVIDRQSVHLTRIVDDLLEVARITHGRVSLDRRPCRVDRIAGEAIEAASPAARLAGHALDVELPDGPVWIDADPTRIVQALQNLLNNAVKYTDPGGRIALTVRRVGDAVEFEVRDTGIGLSADQFDHMFEPFAQDRRTLARRSGGLGIGLALARRLVEMHGGTLTASSPGEGRGACFTIVLPTVAAPAGAERAAAGMPEVAARRVLVVDDNADLLESTQALVQMMGHAVRTAATGQAAIAAVLSEPPDLVLLDIGLPDMDGNDVAVELRRRLGGACPPIVAVTGWGQAEDRRRTSASGFVRHLTKPVDPDALGDVIDAVVRGAGGAVRPHGDGPNGRSA